MLVTFINDLTCFVDTSISNHALARFACGAKLNAQFAGCGLPPRRKDDFAASQVRRFMTMLTLVSVASEMCPDRFTCLNSRGGTSCLDTFLVSKGLYYPGCVTLCEVLDLSSSEVITLLFSYA